MNLMNSFELTINDIKFTLEFLDLLIIPICLLPVFFRGKRYTFISFTILTILHVYFSTPAILFYIKKHYTHYNFEDFYNNKKIAYILILTVVSIIVLYILKSFINLIRGMIILGIGFLCIYFKKFIVEELGIDTLFEVVLFVVAICIVSYIIMYFLPRIAVCLLFALISSAEICFCLDLITGNYIGFFQFLKEPRLNSPYLIRIAGVVGIGTACSYFIQNL